MKNILKKDYLTTAIVAIGLLLTGCSKDPALNHKPIVTLPKDKLVGINEPLRLTAKVIDQDKEEILSYFWSIAAQPKDSNLTLKDPTKKTILFKGKKEGKYYLDFIARDEYSSSLPKRVIITVASPIGEWKADLSKTKEENQLNEEEKIEVAEILSSNYKLIFLENGTLKDEKNTSWKHLHNGKYKLENRELELIDENHLFIIGKLQDKDLKLYYKKVLQK